MQRRSWSAALGFLLPALALYLLFVILPVAQSVCYSLFRWDGVTGRMSFAGLANYGWLARDPVFWRALWHNVLLVVLSLAIQLPIAMGLAVLLSYVRRGRGLLRTAYFAPMVLPTVAIGLLWGFIYQPERGLIDRFVSLFTEHEAFGWLGEPNAALLAVIAAVCWRYIGFHMVLFMAGVESIPAQLYEAGRIDGAGEWQLLRHITLPQLLPVVRMSAVLSIVGSLKYFDLIWVMTKGGPAHASELVATYVFKTGIESQQVGRGCALAVALLVLSFGVTLVVSLLMRRERH
jgi:raffinose/stachyose/melibiose transport system permease protein